VPLEGTYISEEVTLKGGDIATRNLERERGVRDRGPIKADKKKTFLGECEGKPSILAERSSVEEEGEGISTVYSSTTLSLKVFEESHKWGKSKAP